jgi:hypothetical protein
MAAIRPTQFSALNSLNRLNQEEEQGEDNDGYPDHQQIVHP